MSKHKQRFKCGDTIYVNNVKAIVYDCTYSHARQTWIYTIQYPFSIHRYAYYQCDLNEHTVKERTPLFNIDDKCIYIDDVVIINDIFDICGDVGTFGYRVKDALGHEWIVKEQSLNKI